MAGRWSFKRSNCRLLVKRPMRGSGKEAAALIQGGLAVARSRADSTSSSWDWERGSPQEAAEEASSNSS